MALFSFGKKDKNPTQPPPAVGKTSPTPPKIQTPPGSGPVPTARPGKAPDLIPAVGLTGSVATTQPMVMPRQATVPTRMVVAAPADKPTRSTQKIALASKAGLAGASQTVPMPAGRINLPVGIILRCLPPEVLTSDLAEFEASGAAATEVGLPMNLLLNQLPSGKIEMALQEIVPHFPPGYLKPTEAIKSYLPVMITLPLMDVVMRIPPDLLALRPDQRDVDSSVINMADPFTEDLLREQAEAAKAPQPEPPQSNIIDESQVPVTEEFVPRDQIPAPKSFIPPPRPPTTALPVTKLPSFPAPQPPPAAQSTPPPPTLPRSNPFPAPLIAVRSSPVPPPTPNSVSRRVSPSGQLPAPLRASSPLPRPQAAPTVPVALPPQFTARPETSGGNLRPTPRSAPPLPQTPQPPLRQSVRLPEGETPEAPAVSSPSDAPATATSSSTAEVAPAQEEQPAPPPAKAPSFPAPGEPDAAADELQRLAALAMSELGDNEPEEPPAATGKLPQTGGLPVTGKLPDSDAVSASTSIAEEAPAIPPPPSTESFRSSETKDQTRSYASKSIPASALPPPPDSAPQPPPAQPEKTPEKPSETLPPTSSPEAAFNLNSCTASDLIKIPGCTQSLAESIVRQRNKIGSFKKIEDLLEVPGMNSAAYSSLTGEAPPQSTVPQSLSELLGFPEDKKVSLADVTDRICCWPDVTGCILGQSSGLSLVGTVPKTFDKAAIVAFAPRMFESINKSFGEIAGRETNELIIPTSGTSFHILRNKDLYLIILSRLPQMPDRHVKIARMVLAGLSLQSV